MTHWFFLSYARDNLDGGYLEKFFDELNSTIRHMTTPSESKDGFLDVRNVKLGEDWSDALGAALQNSRVFVSVYSPAYFVKENCGREWQIFSERLAAYSATLPPHAKRPALMMPVLWLPESDWPSPLPEAASAVQYKHSDFGEVYARVGLWQLIKNKKYHTHYLSFLDSFAKKLLTAARDHSLPPHQHPPPFKYAKNAFYRPVAEASNPTEEAVKGGSRHVQFVFVAGRRQELQRLRAKVEPYGEEGGYDWQPFRPESTDEVGLIAQDVVTQEKMYFGVVPLDHNAIGRIEEAEHQNRIVAIIVDTWTLCLKPYDTFMAEYDKRNFVNCAVLIPWNNGDDETEVNRPALTNKLWGTFQRHAVKPDPSCFRDSIFSLEEFKRELRVTLNRTRARIDDKAEVVKKAESVEVIPLPRIM